MFLDGNIRATIQKPPSKTGRVELTIRVGNQSIAAFRKLRFYITVRQVRSIFVKKLKHTKTDRSLISIKLSPLCAIVIQSV